MFKTFPAEIATVVRSRRGRRNVRVLARFTAVLLVMILVYSAAFHMLMLLEGQEHTWITGFYWTLTVMSTLGFGDITFHTDIGRLFSILVLASGMIFFLILLPFTFIEFFYEPWMSAQAAQRAPRQLPEETRGHVLLTHYDAVTSAVIRRLEQYNYTYALMVPDVEEALRLHDLGLSVVVGDLDDPETWGKVRLTSAALVASTGSDVKNTSVAFTARAIAPDLPIVTSAKDEESVEVLELAGSSLVLRLEEMIGQSFSQRTVGGDAMSHVIGQFDDVMIAEATAHRTPMVGKTLLENQLRDKVGVTVVGVWERGRFEAASPNTMIEDNTVLVLAGSKEQLFSYDELFCIYNISIAPVVILGGGRVGRATARSLAKRDVDYRIVEVLPERIGDSDKYILGSAADRKILEQAGIGEAPAVIITTHEDDLNVYLTIYCRQLRPDIQILARATDERNVATLHRAGADSVLSYASMGAGAVMNLLERSQFLMIAEGLGLFKVRVPTELEGQTLIESGVRERTGCSVVAVPGENGNEVGPHPSTILPAGEEIVLIGTAEAEKRFLQLFGNGGSTRV
ncbi:MAG: NAD-binding protein [Acidobacteriota bacterium]